MVQLRTSLPTAPVIEQASAVCESIDQSTPLPLGSGSLIVTPAASPGPALLAVTVKPICVPAFTAAASAVFSSDRSGQSTVVVSDAVSVGAFDASSVAVFG